MIGPQAYKLLKSLIAPAKPGDTDYKNLVQTLTQHYEPAPSEIVRRYRFNTRVRRKEESVATYVSELRGLAQFCSFGNSLETMLRDRLVCGSNDEAIQCRLLAESSLDLKKVLELAQGMEAAAQNVREMRGISQAAGQSVDIHLVSNKKTDFVCYRCGQQGHGPSHCSFRTAKCHRCGKVGHIQKVCQSKKPFSKADSKNSNKHPSTYSETKDPKGVKVIQNEASHKKMNILYLMLIPQQPQNH